nr:PaaI family thioesterase [Pelagibacterium limicola]
MHANRGGVVHGGMLSAFVDRAFGQMARETSAVDRVVTISLTVQFMIPMPIGQFATIAPKIVRMTGRLAFVEGTLICDSEPIVSAQGVWRLIRST